MSDDLSGNHEEEMAAPVFRVNPGIGRGGSDSAFTLLEILVAVVIFGIIMLTIFSSFRAFMVSAQMIRDNMVASETGSAVATLMERDLLSLRISLPPEYSRPGSIEADGSDRDIFRFSGDETTGGKNTFSRVRFASLAHISFGGGSQRKSAGSARIIYYVRPGAEQTFDLCRSDTLNVFDESEGSECDPVICKDVTKFKVTYMDLEGDEQTHWDSESDEFGYATPVSLLIDMEFRAEDSLHSFSTRISMPLFRPEVK